VRLGDSDGVDLGIADRRSALLLVASSHDLDLELRREKIRLNHGYRIISITVNVLNQITPSY
jgi:hypothetical protein